MDFKKGGGDKLQPYNKDNGEYERNPQCEKDTENLVLNRAFGCNEKAPIAFPIYGIHDKQYCVLLIEFGLDCKNPIIPRRKIEDYLLVPQDKDDKCHIMNLLGYERENWQELEYQIRKGTTFEKKKYSRFDEDKFTITAETKLLNKNTGYLYNCTTVWKVELDFRLRFVTLIPKEYKDEKN